MSIRSILGSFHLKNFPKKQDKRTMVMASAERGKPTDFPGKKIVWVTFLILDTHLHKTSQLEILRHLAKRCHSANLIAVRSKNVFQIGNSQVRIISIPLRYVPMISNFMFGVIIFFFLPFYIIVSKPDFIITQPTVPILSFISTIPFCKSKRAKFILDVRTVPVETVGFRGFLETFLFATRVLIARKLFDGMTIITSQMKEEVCRRFHLDPKLLGVWSSGVSTSLFKPENCVSASSELRGKLGLSKKFVVFYHGALLGNRGLIETIEAMLIVRRAYPDVVLFLLGRGPMVPGLKELVQKEGLQNNVIIHDPVDYSEVPKHVAMGDVGIVPLPDLSYWRFQCPLKLLEYLAMKKVVIVTDIPAHRVIIGKEKCGIYISSVKPIEIAKSITYAYHNKEKLGEWGKIGRTIIKQKYTWEKVARDLENYLLSIDEKVD
jgi:glycosyltransferase involved in cell wall biosynthesis